MNTLTPKLLLERVPGISTESAGYGTSWYFAARTIGTFCGAFLLAKLSERGYFRINMIIAMIAVCGLWFATGQAAILTLVCIIASRLPVSSPWFILWLFRHVPKKRTKFPV